MTRHEESRAEGRLARGRKLQIENKWFWCSVAVNSGHTIMYCIFQKGQKKKLCFHHKEMVPEEMSLFCLENDTMYQCI